MSTELSKGKKILFLATIFLTNIIIGADLVLSPTINAIYEMFPNSIGIVNFAISGPYLIAIFVSPFAAKLINKFSAKKLLIIGGILAGIGCIFLLFMENPIWLVSMRILYGFGYSFTIVCGVAIIAQVYTDEKKYGTIIGIYNAFLTGISAVAGVIAGNLAAISIKMTYRVFWIIVPLIIMEIVFLPASKRIQNKDDESNTIAEEKTSDLQAKKKGFGAKFWIMAVNYGLISLAGCAFTIFVSIYVIENGIGNEATVGYVNMLFSISGALFVLLLGKLLEKFKHRLAIFLYAGLAIDFAVLHFFPTTAGVYIGFALLGALFGSVIAFGYAYLPMIVPKERVNDAIGFVTTSTCLGSFLSTYAVTWLMNLMNTDLYTPITIVMVGVAVIVVFIEIIVDIKWKEAKTKVSTNEIN